MSQRTRLNWTYDANAEELITPAGQKIRLAYIAQLLQDQITCTHDLGGPWQGWTLRGQYLRGPNGVRLTPATAAAAKRWQDGEHMRDRYELEREKLVSNALNRIAKITRAA